MPEPRSSVPFPLHRPGSEEWALIILVIVELLLLGWIRVTFRGVHGG